MRNLSILRKVLGSAACFLLFGFALHSAPWLGEAPEPPREVTALPRPPSPRPADPGHLRLAAADLGVQTLQVAFCDPETWHPRELGVCGEECHLVIEERGVETAKLAWTYSSPSPGTALHSLPMNVAYLQCPLSGPGQILLLETPSDFGSSFGDPQRLAGHRDEDSPVPLIPGAVRLAESGSGGWTVTLDRPRHLSVALDQLKLKLTTEGWAALDLPAERRDDSTALSMIFLRDGEMLLAHVEPGALRPLLVCAHSSEGLANEVF